MKTLRIGIVGSTGAVGRELLYLLQERNFPIDSLTCFNSKEDSPLSPESFLGLDLVFFATSASIAKLYAPFARAQGVLVIDLSSAFRDDPLIPLVIPEINPEALEKHHGIISSPNCAATIILMPLFPLHKICRIKRVIVSTYQAASGAGYKAMKELEEGTKAHLEGRPYNQSIFPSPYAFNLFLHNSPSLENDYLEEEDKIVSETKKILEDESIKITATCVRVPTMRSHAASINVEFHSSIEKEEAISAIENAPGVSIWKGSSFVTPIDATEKNDVLVGRIRKDLSSSNALDLWVVGDQLRKGAALNAVQIAEHLFPALRL